MRLASILPALTALVLGAAGCASSRHPLPAVDLAEARRSVAEAEAAAADLAPAADCVERARQHLREAELLVQAPTPDERERASGLSRLAQAEAACAAALVAAVESARQASEDVAARGEQAGDAAEARALRAEGEARRLEERVALLQRHLDAMETELIRSKARLKGVETRAEASAALAEAGVLMRRALEARGRTDALALCQVSLDKAEDAMDKENFGMAVFYAGQARDRAAELLQPPAELPRDRPSARSRYVVAVSRANLRAEPGTSSAAVGSLEKGQTVEALALRGEWVQVRAGSRSGWILRSLLE